MNYPSSTSDRDLAGNVGDSLMIFGPLFVDPKWFYKKWIQGKNTESTDEFCSEMAPHWASTWDVLPEKWLATGNSQKSGGI